MRLSNKQPADPNTGVASLEDTRLLQHASCEEGGSSTKTFLNLLAKKMGAESRPFSALNYFRTLASFMELFSEIEVQLRKRQNPVWARAYKEFQ